MILEHLAWLKHFAAAVRKRDFAAGRALCHSDICSFGTVVFRAAHLDDLEANQWQIIWNSTRDFDFDYASADAIVDSSLAVLLTTWHSAGADASGNEFERRGRATVVLQRHGGQWLAVHTHFSSQPKL